MPMKRIALVLILITSPILAAEKVAPPASILIGSVTLEVGMPQDRVISQFAESYRLQKLRESGKYSDWSVFTSGKPGTMIAHLNFESGKLTGVSKSWYLEEDSSKGVEFASGLYGAIAQFISEGKRSCSIDAQQHQSPGMETKTIYIVCGDKYLSIVVNKVQNYAPGAQLEEGFTSWWFPRK